MGDVGAKSGSRTELKSVEAVRHELDQPRSAGIGRYKPYGLGRARVWFVGDWLVWPRFLRCWFLGGQRRLGPDRRRAGDHTASFRHVALERVGFAVAMEFVRVRCGYRYPARLEPECDPFARIDFCWFERSYLYASTRPQ